MLMMGRRSVEEERRRDVNRPPNWFATLSFPFSLLSRSRALFASFLCLRVFTVVFTPLARNKDAQRGSTSPVLEGGEKRKMAVAAKEEERRRRLVRWNEGSR